MSLETEVFADGLPDSLGQCLCRDVELADHTTYRVGGRASLWLEPDGEAQLRQVLELASTARVPVALLGNGSNVIAPDQGIEGLVIKLGGRFSAIRVLDENTLYAQAGALLQQVSERALQLGRSGLEWMTDIPASVGGATLMNAGNNEGDMKRVLRRVHFVGATGAIEQLEVADCDFQYRHSRFMQRGEVVVGAEFSLGPTDCADAIRQRMHQQKVARRDKFPMEYANAGSVFKRPPGHYAGRLIEQAGLKGLRAGGAQISTKHAGFIVNLGGARAADILQLIATVQSRVLAHSGVELQPEQIMLEAQPWPRSLRPRER